MIVNPRPSLSHLAVVFVRAFEHAAQDERVPGRLRFLAVVFAFVLVGLIGFVLTSLLSTPSPSAPMGLPFDLWYVVPAIFGIALALLRFGQFVMQMYSLKSLWRSLRHVLSTTFGIRGVSITVGGGEIERPKGEKQKEVEKHKDAIEIGGPGTLSVKADSAVITERGGGFARTLGPGNYSLGSFERVRYTFDLRKQSFSDSPSEVVLTKDGIPIRVRVSTVFRLMNRMEDEEVLEPAQPGFRLLLRAWLGRPIKSHELRALSIPLPVSPEALRLAAYELPAGAIWNKVTHGSISSSVREVIARRLLDQLFAPDDPNIYPRKEIQKKVFVDGKASLAKRGIELIDVSFDNIMVPDEVVAQRRDYWEAIWQNKSRITLADGEAEWILQYNLARAEAQVEMIYAITHALRTVGEASTGQLPHPLVLRFIHVLARAIDRIMNDSSRKVLSSSQTENILKEMRRVLPKDDRDSVKESKDHKDSDKQTKGS